MTTFSIHPAKYRKGHIVIQCESDGSGFKTVAMWAAEKLGGQWVHRSHGYVLPARKEKLARRYLAWVERERGQAVAARRLLNNLERKETNANT